MPQRPAHALARRRTSPISARAFSASSSTRCSTGRSRRRGGSGARSVGIAGGVSANSRLRADAEARGARAGMPVFVPPLSLSTDNAAMIGAAGLRRYRAGRDRHLGVQRRSVAAAVMYEDLHRLSLVQDEEAAGVRPHHRRGGRDRQEERRRRRDGAGVGDAHHGRRLRQRLGGRPDRRFPGRGSRSWRRPACRTSITRPAKTTPTRT